MKTTRCSRIPAHENHPVLAHSGSHGTPGSNQDIHLTMVLWVNTIRSGINLPDNSETKKGRLNLPLNYLKHKPGNANRHHGN